MSGPVWSPTVVVAGNSLGHTVVLGGGPSGAASSGTPFTLIWRVGAVAGQFFQSEKDVRSVAPLSRGEKCTDSFSTGVPFLTPTPVGRAVHTMVWVGDIVDPLSAVSLRPRTRRST